MGRDSAAKSRIAAIQQDRENSVDSPNSRTARSMTFADRVRASVHTSFAVGSGGATVATASDDFDWDFRGCFIIRVGRERRQGAGTPPGGGFLRARTLSHFWTLGREFL